MIDKIKIKMIVAVGTQLQIGLNGYLPWNNKEYDCYRKLDLKKFQEKTTGCVVVVGYNTWQGIKSLNGTKQRLFLCHGDDIELNRYLALKWDINAPLQAALFRHEVDPTNKPVVWIAGGTKTYEKWWPYIQEVHITEIPYDGPADTYLPDKMMYSNKKTTRLSFPDLTVNKV